MRGTSWKRKGVKLVTTRGQFFWFYLLKRGKSWKGSDRGKILSFVSPGFFFVILAEAGISGNKEMLKGTREESSLCVRGAV
ncbi:hypothetical protein IM40_06070 [Candidatus Paracaedimonas acanthamoebae]|nr:hypothetical protein IM40_06070 [Candidatus Paracaedimonas acanthamoebae]